MPSPSTPTPSFKTINSAMLRRTRNICVTATLNELKQGGFVVSRRGAEGGYLLARAPAAMTMGAIIQFIDGSFGPLKETEGETAARSGVTAEALFEPVWNKAVRAASEILDRMTFASLVEEEQEQASKQAMNYTI